MVPPILTDGYKFSESGVYYAPPAGNLSILEQYVDALPGSGKYLLLFYRFFLKNIFSIFYIFIIFIYV